jgi:predicted metal-dependent peptidase
MGEHRRRNNKERMTIIEQLESMRDNICENYCKYQEKAYSEHKDPDEAMDVLINQYCNNCPFMGL